MIPHQEEEFNPDYTGVISGSNADLRYDRDEYEDYAKMIGLIPVPFDVVMS